MISSLLEKYRFSWPEQSKEKDRCRRFPFSKTDFRELTQHFFSLKLLIKFL